jgi:hypothetical protein
MRENSRSYKKSEKDLRRIDDENAENAMEKPGNTVAAEQSPGKEIMSNVLSRI